MYAKIIIDISNEALDRAYTYRIPEGMSIGVGDRVSIPFGSLKKPKTGYVIGLSEAADYAPEKLKDILGPVEGAVSVREQLIELAVWMSEEYGATLNQCLKTVLPVKRSVRANSRRTDPMQSYSGEEDVRPVLNPEQTAAAAAVLEGLREAEAGAAEKAGGNADAGEDAARRREPPCYLLHGVTGSGKTEVYLRIMEEVLEGGKQVILLIPEISLTYQTVLRVSARFRGRCAVLHSRMSAGERFLQYQRCERGEVDVLVGPRSAVFAPFERLGLLIMDEEHESAYKSETAPRYETRELVKRRGQLAGCPVLYGSATPSLSLYTAAKRGELRLLELRERAVAGSRLARTELIDLRKELEKGNRSVFSERLQEAMRETLQKKEQIMLFMNRRGYSSFVSCRKCGKAVKCPHCDVSLTLHRDGMLRCHYCGYEQPLMKRCPSCGSPYLAPFGTGTEKLESLTRQCFPEARILRMDADTTKNKGGHERLLEQFRRREADILIGTQMIVKGHDFPAVTLVGVVAADMSLSAPDFMAQERTFQLLTQAAGRAGRGTEEGCVIIQSYQPEHAVLRYACEQDYKGFYEEELSFRRLMGYPPAERLLTVQLSSGDEQFLSAVAIRAVRELLPEANAAGAELIGPLNASVYRVNDIFRKIVYIKVLAHDTIIRLRNRFSEQVREHDRRGLIQLNYDMMS